MRQHLEFILIGLLIFIVGTVLFGIELSGYSMKKELPVKIKSNNIEFKVDYDNKKEYQFIRNINNENIVINTYIDEEYNDEILVRVNYLETSKLKYLVSYDDKYTNIVFSNDLNIRIKDIPAINDLLIKCVSNKMIYNYNLIKYSTVDIYSSKNIIEKIKVLDYEDRNR